MTITDTCTEESKVTWREERTCRRCNPAHVRSSEAAGRDLAAPARRRHSGRFLLRVDAAVVRASRLAQLGTQAARR